MEALVFGAIWIIVVILAEMGFDQIKAHSFYFIVTRQGMETQGAFNFFVPISPGRVSLRRVVSHLYAHPVSSTGFGTG